MLNDIFINIYMKIIDGCMDKKYAYADKNY